MARILIAIFLLYLCLTAPCLAERIPFTLETDPPGAKVSDHLGNELAPSGTQGYLELDRYEGWTDLTLQMEGYKTQTVPIRFEMIQNGRYPQEGFIVLEPLSRFISIKRFFKERPWAGALLFLLTAGCGAWVGLTRQKMRQQNERLEKLAHYESTSKQDGSLLMHILGGYRLVSVLGRGGMATVYRGVPDDTLDADASVAVKVLAKAETDMSNFSERFRREVQVYIQLAHPNIVSLLDWGEHEGWTYLVLELVDGQEVRELMPDLSLADSIRILSDIMKAMTFAHAEGVVHRDLKPENVMLTTGGKVKVMDFGLARQEDAKKITQTGAALGTPAYMAPEQIQAGPLDPRTDQYGLAVMAYEMLTNELPFQHEDPIQVIFKHLSAPRPNPCDICKELPLELGEVIVHMMAKEPGDRYETFVDAQEAFLKAARPLL